MQVRELCSKMGPSVIAVLGLSSFVVGSIFDEMDFGGDIRQIGSILLAASIVRAWCIRPAVKPQEQIFAAAYQQGLDQGWKLGHQQARPVVIRFPQAQPEPAHSETTPGGHTAAS